MRRRVPVLLTAGLMNALQGSWGVALADLMHAVAIEPEDPAASLAAGVAALHHASGVKNAADEVRHAWVLRAVALLQKAGIFKSQNNMLSRNAFFNLLPSVGPA